MAFEHPGGGALDYRICRYGQSRLLFRGPKARLAAPFCAFLGGTETFGRFVPRPFPALLGDWMGTTSVNLGVINGGLDAPAGCETVLDLVRRSSTTVIQIVGAHNLSNRFYSVHPRRNDRFLGATDALRALYPEVDFTEFSFTRHLLCVLERRCPDRFALVAAELQERWSARMDTLMAAAGSGVVLLWLADGPPPQEATRIGGGANPPFVDTMMVARLAAKADRLVQVVPSASARAAGTRGMVFSEFETPVAEVTFGPAVHVEIAEALAPALEGLRAAAA